MYVKVFAHLGVNARMCECCEHVCLHVSMCVFIMYVSSCPAEN